MLLAEPGGFAPLEVPVRRDDGWVGAEAALTDLLDDPVVRGMVCNLRLCTRRTVQEQAETRAQQLDMALKSRLVIEQT